MQEFLQNIERTKSITEHISIILNYQQTRFIDRSKAAELYKSFNRTHPDYTIIMNTTAAMTNTLIQIDSAPDVVIVENLKKQVLWAAGEEYMKSAGIII